VGDYSVILQNIGIVWGNEEDGWEQNRVGRGFCGVARPTSSKMELVQNESGRLVKRQVDIYNLDVLIAVGYAGSNSVASTS